MGGISEAQWGSEPHGGTPGKRLAVVDFKPWHLGAYEDYPRKDDKMTTRWANPATMAASAKSIKQKNKLFSAAYAPEHMEERMGSPEFTGDFHYK